MASEHQSSALTEFQAFWGLASLGSIHKGRGGSANALGDELQVAAIPVALPLSIYLDRDAWFARRSPGSRANASDRRATNPAGLQRTMSGLQR